MRERPDKRWTTTVLVAVIGAALALIAVPPALGTKPIRTVIPPEGGVLVLPAGEGCAFEVEVRANEDARVVLTEFSDGRLVAHDNADVTLTNVDTGDAFFQRTRATVTQIHDPEANDVLIEISGRILFSFLPGEQGPLGEVGPDGGLFSVIGHQQLTFDLDSNLTTSYSLDGQAIDICPLLSD